METGFAFQVKCWGHRQVTSEHAESPRSGQTEVRSEVDWRKQEVQEGTQQSQCLRSKFNTRTERLRFTQCVSMKWHAHILRRWQRPQATRHRSALQLDLKTRYPAVGIIVAFISRQNLGAESGSKEDTKYSWRAFYKRITLCKSLKLKSECRVSYCSWRRARDWLLRAFLTVRSPEALGSGEGDPPWDKLHELNLVNRQT